MGPTGDQSLTYAQNRTLAESPNTVIPVHLVEALEPLKYTYAGEVQLIGTPYQEEQFDDEGNTRKVWMFPVKLKVDGTIPLLTEEQARVIEKAQARKARKLSTDELGARAKKAKKQPKGRRKFLFFYATRLLPNLQSGSPTGYAAFANSQRRFRISQTRRTLNVIT